MSDTYRIVLTVIAFIIITLAITAVIDSFSGIELTDNINVARISIDGPIQYGGAQGLFSAPMRDASTIAQEIKDASDDASIDAIILEINSPGGTVVASKEIAEAVEASDKYTIALIREVGASGAYWVSAVSDIIIADSMSITGSIGVIASYLDFSDLMEDYGIKYQRMTGGKYKDLGTPFKNLSNEERAILQKKIDLIHDEFRTVVQERRGFTNSSMDIVGTGEFFIGIEAKELGLVDELGNKETAEEILKEQFGEKAIEYYSFEKQLSFTDALLGNVNGAMREIGVGIGKGLTPESSLKIR